MTQEEVWKKDRAAFDLALKRYIIEIEGEQYLSPSTPTALSTAYARFLSFGYANGYL